MSDPTNTDAPERIGPVGGYAYGNYSCICKDCGSHFIGDKRAYQCPDCVIQMLAKRITPDDAKAMVAVAVDAVADYVERVPGYDAIGGEHPLVTKIRSLTPADARAALDRLLAEAEERGARKAMWKAGEICIARIAACEQEEVRDGDRVGHHCALEARLIWDRIRGLDPAKIAAEEHGEGE